MKSRFEKSMIRDLALVVGLPAVLIALLLACAAAPAPPVAAAPARGALEPAWTSSEPVTRVISPDDPPWVIDRYSVTITFSDDALREIATFTFDPRPDLELDPPVVSTPYIFEFEGYAVDTGLSVSLWGDVEYALQYDESELNGVSEHTLEVYRYSDQWNPQNATVDTRANLITWETNFTGKFGIGGFGPRTYIYFPATFNSGSVRSAQAESQPTD